MATLKIGPDFGDTYAAATEFSDLLDSAFPGTPNAPVGADFGACLNGSYTPVTDKASNTGEKDVYIRHNDSSKITGVKTFISPIPTLSTYTYLGENSGLTDYNIIKALGDASGSSKNNLDNLSGGLWIDMDRDSDAITRFDQANYPDLVKIYGDDDNGITIGTAYIIAKEAMAQGGTEINASNPVDGEIGADGDTTLGEAAHIKLRFYLQLGYSGSGGYCQLEWNIIYTETS